MTDSIKSQDFFDINQFPKHEGLLLFGISMSKIGNTQSPEQCYEYMHDLYEKIVYPVVGLNIIYGDSLYLYSNEAAYTLKNKYQNLIHQHKYGFIKKIENFKFIPKAFNFVSWSQFLLEFKQFTDYPKRLRDIYDTDADFQKYVAQDLADSGKIDITENDINFILEEILFFYLASKGAMRLQNDYVQDKQKWVLWCYPGKPLKSEVYLYQQNFFNLNNPENIYQDSFYDLENKKLYDYTKIELAIFN